MITTSSAFASSTAATSFAPLVNIISGNALVLLGGGIAFAINKQAHQIFAVKNDSHASKAIRAVAFLAGAGACYFVAPHAAIFAVEPLLGSVLVVAFIAIINQPLLAAELALMHSVGLFGRVALISLGTAAAAYGANL